MLFVVKKISIFFTDYQLVEETPVDSKVGLVENANNESKSSGEKTSSRAYPSTLIDPYDKLRRAKKALEEGLLDQCDYDQIKAQLLETI